MNIAYIILAHKLPEQLVRLVRKLNTKTTSFIIHVDKKTDDETYRRITAPLNTYENVHFLNRHVCNWGDFGHLNASLKGIHELLKLGIKFDYAISLSGQDYPIKSNEYIQNYFQEAKEKSFVEYFQLPSERWEGENGGLDRVNYWHFNLRGRRFALRKKNRYVPSMLNPLWSRLAEIPPLRRKTPDNFRIFGGSGVWCLSRRCIEYVNEFVSQNYVFVKFFRHVSSPEEIFFQTLLLNSPLQNLVVNDDLRYIVWPTNSAPHPMILYKHDFERFMSTDKLFARKFDVTVDKEVLDMIDKVTL